MLSTKNKIINRTPQYGNGAEFEIIRGKKSTKDKGDILEYFNKVKIEVLNRYGDKTTTSDKVLEMGKHYFGNRFIGVFASDQIPPMGKNDFLIANTDDSSKGGSHWVALAKDGKETFLYDTYGRKLVRLSPNFLGKKLILTNPNKEQSYVSTRCGQLCIAWLRTCAKFGVKETAEFI